MRHLERSTIFRFRYDILQEIRYSAENSVKITYAGNSTKQVDIPSKLVGMQPKHLKLRKSSNLRMFWKRELRNSAGNTIFRKRYEIPVAKYRKKYRMSYAMSYANRTQIVRKCRHQFLLVVRGRVRFTAVFCLARKYSPRNV